MSFEHGSDQFSVRRLRRAGWCIAGAGGNGIRRAIAADSAAPCCGTTRHNVGCAGGVSTGSQRICQGVCRRQNRHRRPAGGRCQNPRSQIAQLIAALDLWGWGRIERRNAGQAAANRPIGGSDGVGRLISQRGGLGQQADAAPTGPRRRYRAVPIPAQQLAITGILLRYAGADAESVRLLREAPAPPNRLLVELGNGLRCTTMGATRMRRRIFASCSLRAGRPVDSR